MTTSTEGGALDPRAVQGTGALIAPVFDHRRRRNGMWVEIASSSDQAGTIAELLRDHLREKPPEWLFLHDHTGHLRPYLPLDLPFAPPCEQILVRPAAVPAPTKPLPEGLLCGVRGTHKELAGVSGCNWFVVTDAAGPVGATPALADGLAGWQECQPLADLGWEGFLLTGNQRPGGKQPKADQLALTRLLGLVTSDADTDELESLFKSQPRLAFDLLNLVNSPALNLRTPATNFRHAITLLGRRQLQRWLQLLMFTRQTSKGEVNILLWHSAFRGRLMERIGQHLNWSAELSDRAFMTGVFSLIDVLLDESLATLLEPLALAEDILAALVKQQGPLGDLLALAQAIELRDMDRLCNLSHNFSFNVLTLMQLQLETLFWVESFSSPAGD